MQSFTIKQTFSIQQYESFTHLDYFRTPVYAQHPVTDLVVVILQKSNIKSVSPISINNWKYPFNRKDANLQAVVGTQIAVKNLYGHKSEKQRY